MGGGRGGPGGGFQSDRARSIHADIINRPVYTLHNPIPGYEADLCGSGGEHRGLKYMGVKSKSNHACFVCCQLPYELKQVSQVHLHGVCRCIQVIHVHLRSVYMQVYGGNTCAMACVCAGA